VTERLLEAREVAELLSVPVGWVREHTRSGAIPSIELGRYRRYDRGDVLAWVESMKAGGGPAFRRHEPRGRTTRAAEGGAR
jgi:excisionase family DNA binding protein